MFYQRSAK